MADEADRAQVEEARALQEALRKRKRTLIPTGYCHYCGEGVKRGFLFCGLDCGSEYEREQDIRARQGR